MDVLLQLIGNYRTPSRILDFGSGSGEMTNEFLKRGFDVTPLEPMTHGYLKDQNYSSKFDVVIAVEVIEQRDIITSLTKLVGHLTGPGTKIQDACGYKVIPDQLQ